MTYSDANNFHRRGDVMIVMLFNVFYLERSGETGAMDVI
jgi:hypothetical protein